MSRMLKSKLGCNGKSKMIMVVLETNLGCDEKLKVIMVVLEMRMEKVTM